MSEREILRNKWLRTVLLYFNVDVSSVSSSQPWCRDTFVRWECLQLCHQLIPNLWHLSTNWIFKMSRKSFHSQNVYWFIKRLKTTDLDKQKMERTWKVINKKASFRPTFLITMMRTDVSKLIPDKSVL